MSVFLDSQKIDQIVQIALEAGEIARDFFVKKNFSITSKSDGSKVTSADIALSKFINIELKKLSNELPIVCEEGQIRSFNGDSFWLIDPIDGTNSFIAGNGEFSINIALIINKIPFFGLIYAPFFEDGKMMFVDAENKIIEMVNGKKRIINFAAKKSQESLRIVASSRINDEKITSYTAQFYSNFSGKIEVEKLSSSIKFFRLLENRADVYLHFRQTMEWDTAAGHALIRKIGGEIKNLTFEQEKIVIKNSLIYKKESFLNPAFIAKVLW